MPEVLLSNDPLSATRALGVEKFAAAPSGESASGANANHNQPAVHRPTLCKADLARADLTGLTLGPYTLGPKLGGGGMGTIFAARHVHLEKEFAIKFIGSAAAHSPEARTRFDHEVKALGKLQHPNIVSAVDAGCVDDIPYLVTERIFGQDLGQIVQRNGALTAADACELVRSAAEGLAHSHACGILHRDIKPSNLILDRIGVVKILDFGLVRHANAEPLLTVDGALLGTLDFISPEQAQDPRAVDPRSDLYSLGCTLLYLLSGHPPFDAPQYTTAAAKIKGHLLDTPAWLSAATTKCPAPLLAILRRMLAKNPAERFAAAAEIVDVLTPWCRGNQVLQLLDADRQGKPAAEEETTVANQAASRAIPTQRRLGWGLGLSCATLVLGMIGTGFWFGLPRRDAQTQATVPAPTAVPTPEETTATARETETPPRELPDEPSPEPTPTPTAEPTPPSVALIPPEPALPIANPAIVTRETKKTASASAIKLEIPSASKKNQFAPFGGMVPGISGNPDKP